MNSYILDEAPIELGKKFLADYKALFPDIDLNTAARCANLPDYFEEQTSKWYKDLVNAGMNKAYAVYDDDYYFTDVFKCFVMFSRRYMRDLRRAYFGQLQNIKTIVDLGNGIGYTTKAFKQLFPDAKVYGVNLPGTKQWKFCEWLATVDQEPFHMVGNIHDIPEKVDMIFASEYFEHIINPMEHVEDIVKNLQPRIMLIANAFNTHSIGHFPYYFHGNEVIHQVYAAKKFNKFVRNLGYVNSDTKLFNNKPMIFEKHDQP